MTFKQAGNKQNPGRSRRCPWRRILVPLDFSRHSLRALDYAVSLAGQLHAKVSLLHVVVPDTHPLTHPVRQLHLQELLAESRRNLARLHGPLCRCGLAGEVRACVGLPFEQIPTAARELHADLLVLTTQRRRGLVHLLMGSTAELVLRRAPCPVLVVHDETRSDPPLSPS